MSPLAIYLVRHGQTACSRETRFCGSQTDVPLLPQGHAMAEALAERYGAERWAGVYSSPLLRARQTAEPLARRAGCEVRVLPELREIDYGAWEGLMEADIRARYPGDFAAWWDDPGRHAPTAGETVSEIAARVMSSIDLLRREHAGGKVLAVSHKTTIRIAICALLGMDTGLYRTRIGQPVSGVTVFEFRASGPFLRVMGDVSHLPPHLRDEAVA